MELCENEFIEGKFKLVICSSGRGYVILGAFLTLNVIDSTILF